MAGILGVAIVVRKWSSFAGRELMQEKAVGLMPSAHLSFQKGRAIMSFLKFTFPEFILS